MKKLPFVVGCCFRAVVPNQDDFIPQKIFGNVWRHFWLPKQGWGGEGRELLLASQGKKRGVWYIIQCTGHPTAENYPLQNICNAEVEKPWFRANHPIPQPHRKSRQDPRLRTLWPDAQGLLTVGSLYFLSLFLTASPDRLKRQYKGCLS